MHWFERWVIPTKCVLTEQLGAELDLAPGIIASLNKPLKVCPQCCEQSADSQLCGACISQPPAFTKTRIAYYFEKEMVELIHQLKYQKQTSHARLLAELYIEAMQMSLKDSEVEALVAVPCHRLKRRQRGFNQAELLAINLGKILGLPVLKNAALRVKASPSQTGLSKSQRKRNLAGAFKVDKNVINGYKHIAIVDDVMTTGATINTLAKVLKKANNTLDIEAWAIAKTK